MRVGGHEISDAVIEGARRWCVAQRDGFRSSGLMFELERLGVPGTAAYRAADRIVTKFKTAGFIRLRSHALWEVAP